MKKALEESVKEMTSGGFIITVVEPGSVVAADGEWDAVQVGTLHGAFTTPVNNKKAFGAVAGLFTEYAISPNPDAFMAWYLHGDGLKLQQELIDKTPGYNKVMTLGPFSASGAEVDMVSKRQINTIADFKGLKFRAFGDWGKVLTDLGAAVVGMPAGEVYEALQRGVLDACELSDIATNVAFGLHEVAKFWYYPGVHAPMATCDFYVNKDEFNKLPPAYQKILREVTKSTLAHNFSMMPVLNAEALPKALAAGVQLIETPIEIQAELAKRADALWRSIGEGDEFFKKVYDNQQAFAQSWAEIYMKMQPNIPMLLAYQK